jgi:hypothetical protein
VKNIVLLLPLVMGLAAAWSAALLRRRRRRQTWRARMIRVMERDVQRAAEKATKETGQGHEQVRSRANHD